MAKIRRCLVCGKEYEFCPKCSKNADESWRFVHCSYFCNETNDLIRSYENNDIDSLQLKNEIESRYSDINILTDYIKEKIEKYIGTTTNTFDKSNNITNTYSKKKKNKWWEDKKEATNDFSSEEKIIETNDSPKIDVLEEAIVNTTNMAMVEEEQKISEIVNEIIEEDNKGLNLLY